MGLARLLGGVEVMAGEHHLRPQCLHPGDLERVRRGGGKQGEGDAMGPAGKGQGLPPVARAGPHQATACQAAIGQAGGDEVARAAALEGADGIGRLELEGERTGETLTQGFAIELGGVEEHRVNEGGGAQHVAEAQAVAGRGVDGQGRAETFHGAPDCPVQWVAFRMPSQAVANAGLRFNRGLTLAGKPLPSSRRLTYLRINT